MNERPEGGTKAWRSASAPPSALPHSPVVALPPLPSRLQWERRLSRFSSCRASRASWATRSSMVAGPPGLGSEAREESEEAAPALPPQDPRPQPTCCPGPQGEPSTVRATCTLVQPQCHSRATGDPPTAHCPHACSHHTWAAMQDRASRGRRRTTQRSPVRLWPRILEGHLGHSRGREHKRPPPRHQPTIPATSGTQLPQPEVGRGSQRLSCAGRPVPPGGQAGRQRGPPSPQGMGSRAWGAGQRPSHPPARPRSPTHLGEPAAAQRGPWSGRCLGRCSRTGS